MLHRHHWLVVALLLFLALLGGNGATAGFASETQVASSVPDILCFEGQPLDRRHAIASEANDSADEEGPPAKVSRASSAVPLWSRELLVGSGYEMAPSYVGGAPTVQAGRPRAPPLPL
jgi:hypothetical protein